MRQTAIFGALAIAFLACVGSDPVPTSDSRIDPGASSSGGSGSSDGGGGGTCPGTQPSACGPACKVCGTSPNGQATCMNGVCGLECDPSSVKCGDTCAVLASSGEHCGKCDHGCGGGACTNGVCQPVIVMQGLSATVSFDVGATKVVASMNGASPPTSAAIVSCDLPAGCGTGAPKKLIEGYKSIGGVVIVDQEIFWIAGSNGDSEAMWLRRCPIEGCPVMPEQVQTDTGGAMQFLTRGGNGLVWRRNATQAWGCTLPICAPIQIIDVGDTVALATDGTSLFYTEPVASQPPQLRSCALGATCTLPKQLASLRLGGPMTVHAGKLYVADQGTTPINQDGYIYTLSASVPGSQALFAREEKGPVDVVADVDGVYWANTDQKTVRTCPLTGCTGAPREIGTNQLGVKAVRRDAKFVYWMTEDAIYKVAK